MVKINEYIESGILEAYVLGSASEAEARKLLYLKSKYPQIEQALFNIELDVEKMAQSMAITPPPETWLKIEGRINELIEMRETEILIGEPPKRNGNNSRSGRGGQFIEIDAESNHMRVHKLWRWGFIGVFILGKIFLAFALYFYFKNLHNEAELESLNKKLQTEQRGTATR